MAFEILPKVNKCCFCIKSLKCACFIIIVIGLLLGIDTAAELCAPYCESLFTVEAPTKILTNIVRWILLVAELALMASLLAFIFGLFWSIKLTAIIVIYCALSSIVVSILFFIVVLIHQQHTICEWYETQIFAVFLSSILWTYFIIVINSHAKENM